MSDKKQDAIALLHNLQKNLKAPKNQRNNFGNYNYRSCEDILQAAKAILPEGAIILVFDDIVLVGDRIYVQATAQFSYDGKTVTSTAFAREPLTKKGMDESQITGATSSYARKYALNGLLLIDDNKDADSMDNSQKEEKPHPSSKQAKEAKKLRRESHPVVTVIAEYLADESQWEFAKEALAEITDEKEKKEIWSLLNTKEQGIVRTFKAL